ncbi:MAG: hypothetical protein B0A82_18090, partial [Alkalinema sp. CACIAM 70d]
YFTEALDAARSIQDEYRRASVLSSLAQIDNADFTQLLDAARSIQDEYRRADVLSRLAQIDNADFTQLLEAARSIQDEYWRVDVLSNLAKSVPQDFLPTLYQAIIEISHKPSLAKALSGSLPRLPFASLPHTDWKSYLHLLAHRKRADLLGDLVTLYPAILHLGGEGTMRGIVEEMKRICRQWP